MIERRRFLQGLLALPLAVSVNRVYSFPSVLTALNLEEDPFEPFRKGSWISWRGISNTTTLNGVPVEMGAYQRHWILDVDKGLQYQLTEEYWAFLRSTGERLHIKDEQSWRTVTIGNVTERIPKVLGSPVKITFV